jgi:hypothetical protein
VRLHGRMTWNIYFSTSQKIGNFVEKCCTRYITKAWKLRGVNSQQIQ